MVSVAICTYNGAAYLKEELKSILTQTVQPDEIVLCDDGSTDGTVEIAKRMLESTDIPHKIFVNNPNLGVTHNFEKAIASCTGDIIFTADQDDVWMPDKIETQQKAFEDAGCVLAFSDARVTDKNLHVTSESLWQTVCFSKSRRQLFREHRYYEVLFTCGVVTGAAMAVRRDFAQSCMPFPPAGPLHDDWLALNAPQYGTLAQVEKPLILYRQHGSNVVGIRSQRLWDKVKWWFLFVRSEKFYDEAKCAYLRSVYLFEKHKVHWNEAENKLFADWALFHRGRAAMLTTPLFCSVGIVLTGIVKNGYGRYRALIGTRSQDVLFVLFRRRGKAWQQKFRMQETDAKTTASQNTKV